MERYRFGPGSKFLIDTNIMKKILTALYWVLVLNACDSNPPPDYEYRTITGESSYTNWYPGRIKAMAKVDFELSAYAKNACRRAIRTGWSISKIEYEGEMNCEQSSKGHHCRKKDVVLVCRRVSEFFP